MTLEEVFLSIQFEDSPQPYSPYIFIPSVDFLNRKSLPSKSEFFLSEKNFKYM